MSANNRRSEQSPWYQQMLLDRERQYRRDDERMRRKTPYRATAGCDHERLVETTCDVQRPLIQDDGTVARFAIRARVFECADCSVGMWPRRHEGIPRRPVCTAPLCDCFSDQFEERP